MIEKNEFYIDFGKQPVSNRFQTEKNYEAPSFPLKIRLEEKYGSIKLVESFPLEELKPRYDWITCYEPESHLDKLTSDIVKSLNLKKDANILGYSFKDETTLIRLNKIGYKNTYILDPMEDLKITDKLANIETFQSIFTRKISKEIKNKRGTYDLIIARHVLEHSYNIEEFILTLLDLLSINGYLVLEIPDCEKPFQRGDCTTLWEEHQYYFTRDSFRRLLSYYGLEIVYEKTWNYQLENSLVSIVKKNSDFSKIDSFNVSGIIDKDIYLLQNFKSKIEERKFSIQKKLHNFVRDLGQISIFGAGHLTIAFLSMNNLSKYIKFAIDDNQNKKGLFLPIGGIEIIDSSKLNPKITPLCLLGLNPDHHENIRQKFSNFINKGGKMLSIFPGTPNDVEKNL